MPPRPGGPVPANQADPLYPPQLGAGDNIDAPPSYEDALADDIGPLDGPRREYSGVTDENAPSQIGDGEKVPGYSARPGQTTGPSALPGQQSGSRNGNGNSGGAGGNVTV